jgi:hypothetical protein
MTEPLRQRLEGKKDFYEIQKEVLDYFTAERAKLLPTDTLGHALSQSPGKILEPLPV